MSAGECTPTFRRPVSPPDCNDAGDLMYSSCWYVQTDKIAADTGQTYVRFSGTIH